jgi:hypothetical protein
MKNLQPRSVTGNKWQVRVALRPALYMHRAIEKDVGIIKTYRSKTVKYLEIIRV